MDLDSTKVHTPLSGTIGHFLERLAEGSVVGHGYSLAYLHFFLVSQSVSGTVATAAAILFVTSTWLIWPVNVDGGSVHLWVTLEESSRP